MLLRIVASSCVFLIVAILAVIAAIMTTGNFTLYSTRDNWIWSTYWFEAIIAILLVSGLISASYFRFFSLPNVRHQPYVNIFLIALTILIFFQTEFEGVPTPDQIVEIKILPDRFKVGEHAGTDVVAVLTSALPQHESDDHQIILTAFGEVEYDRIHDAFLLLRNAGYRNIALSTNTPETP